jgi:muramoyltetrapeptide carboxypeptidase
VIDSVDWSKLKKRPELYFQGYSDITMITCALFNKGYGHPVAGPNSGSIAGMTEDSIEAMRSVYSGTQLGPIQLESLNPGDCSGKPLPGLLHRLEILSRKPYCPSAEGRIVFIEAVGTTAEMIEENLDALLKRNFLKGATGVVFCQFVRCRDNEKIDLILKKFASKLKIPVYKGFPFGHTSRIYCLDFARQAEIKDNAIIFPAVSAASKKK